MERSMAELRFGRYTLSELKRSLQMREPAYPICCADRPLQDAVAFGSFDPKTRTNTVKVALIAQRSGEVQAMTFRLEGIAPLLGGFSPRASHLFLSSLTDASSRAGDTRLVTLPGPYAHTVGTTIRPLSVMSVSRFCCTDFHFQGEDCLQLYEPPWADPRSGGNRDWRGPQVLRSWLLGRDGRHVRQSETLPEPGWVAELRRFMGL